MNPFDELIAGHQDMSEVYFRANIPVIRQLESLDELSDLRFVGQKTIGQMDFDNVELLALMYEANGPSLFPAVRQRLLDEGAVKRSNMLHTSVKNKGTSEEVYNVTMGFYGNRLQISLDVHKQPTSSQE